ncbi:MAG: hypothetical protein OEV20_09470, partial [Actinomycetota bacterium]|nr:hypothetical protein [Actinomycetota bacterium]
TETTDLANVGALVTALNDKLGASSVSGRVRAVEVVGVGGIRRLGFAVDDSTSRELKVTAVSDGAKAVLFETVPVGAFLLAQDLDEELKGLGDLRVNPTGPMNVSLEVEVPPGGKPVVSLAFHLDAARTTRFAIDLGEAADDYSIGFGPNDNLELSSIFGADLTLRFEGEADDPSGQTFEVDVESPTLSAEVLNGGANVDTSLFTGKDPIKGTDPVDMNLGFLGTRIGPATEAPVIEMHVAWRPGDSVGWEVVGDAATGVSTQVTELTAGTVNGGGASDPLDRFRVDLPIQVLLPAGFDGAFSTSLGIESALGLSALDGRNALDADADTDGTPDAFESLDSIKLFAKLDPTTYISLLGQIRGGLDAVRQSDIFQAIDLPFVQGAVGRVADLADAFGDAVLFDDGDDGIDSREDDVLVTRLNQQLRDAKLDSLVRFKVKVDKDGDTKLVFEALSPNVDQIKVETVRGFNFANTDFSKDPLESDIVSLDTVRQNGFELVVTVTQRGDLPEKSATLQQDGGDITVPEEGQPENPDLKDESKATSLRSIGNDVAKLLDENNQATFDTVQELTERFVEMLFPSDFDPDSTKPFKWDSATSILTFTLDFDADLIDVDLPVDFELDLGPIGDISVAEGSKITVGGEVGFELTLGLNLGTIPGKELKADENDTSDLDDLAGVKKITDIIRLTPSITADREPGETVSGDEEDQIAFILDEAALAEGVQVEFFAAQNVAIVAESLINGV